MSGSFWQSSHFRQWLFDKEDLLLGRQADLNRLTVDEYQKVHIFFGHFIQAIGEELKVRQQVIATAMIYFKRFYARYSLKDIDPLLLSPTCLFLASKVEECGASPNSRVIEKCATVSKMQRFYNVFGIDYPYRVNDVHDCEFLLMEVLDCSLIVFQPYRPLCSYCEDIGDHHNELLRRSWVIINDVLRSDLILTQPPYMLAMAALAVACCQKSNYQSMSSEYRSWFAETTVDLDQLQNVIQDIFVFLDLWNNFKEEEEMPKILHKFSFIRSMKKS